MLVRSNLPQSYVIGGDSVQHQVEGARCSRHLFWRRRRNETLLSASNLQRSSARRSTRYKLATTQLDSLPEPTVEHAHPGCVQILKPANKSALHEAECLVHQVAVCASLLCQWLLLLATRYGCNMAAHCLRSGRSEARNVLCFAGLGNFDSSPESGQCKHAGGTCISIQLLLVQAPTNLNACRSKSHAQTSQADDGHLSVPTLRTRFPARRMRRKGVNATTSHLSKLPCLTGQPSKSAAARTSASSKMSRDTQLARALR